MPIKLSQISKSLSLTIVFLLGLGFGDIDSHAQETAEGKATFYVY